MGGGQEAVIEGAESVVSRFLSARGKGRPSDGAWAPFGSRTSDDIVFSQRDVNEIPGDVNERRVDFLNAMYAVGRNDEAVISHFRAATAVFAEPGDGEHFPFARSFE